MIGVLPDTYEGDAPYIFVSYCHTNRDKVMPVLDFLTAEGFRIWYDEGIDAGSEWPEVIAEHLEHSAAFLAFISEESLKSHNCKREFNYAIMENKPSIAIWLDPVELTPVMKLQMSSVQAINGTNLECDSITVQLRKAKILERCRGRTKDIVQEYGTNAAIKSEVQKKDNRIRSRKIIYGVMLLGAFFILLLILLFVITIHYAKGCRDKKTEQTVVQDKTKEMKSDDADQAGQTQEVSQAADDFIHITLTASEAMSINQYYDALELLQNRLDLLAGKENYKMTVNEDMVELDIPEAAFGTHQIEQILQCYIICEGSLYLFYNLKDMSLTDWESVHIDKSDIKNVKLVKEIPDGIGVEEPGNEQTCYIEVTLTDKGAEKNRKKLVQWEDAAVFCINIISGGTMYHNDVYFSDNKDTLYLINNDGEKFARLQLYNLEQNDMGGGFRAAVDWKIDWQDTDTLEWKGIYQKNVDAIEGATVTALYEISNHSREMTQGQKMDIENTLRSRLDVLAMPYAIGDYMQRDVYYFAVRTTPDHMNLILLDAIVGQNTTCWVQSEGSMEGIRLENHAWEIDKDVDGSGRQLVRIKLAEDVIESFEQFWESLDGDKGLRLLFNDIPYFVGGKYDQEQKEIVFDGLYYSGTGLSEDNCYLVDFLEAYYKNVFPSGFFGTLKDYRCSARDVQEDFWGACNYEDMKQMKERILQIDSDAAVTFDRGTVQVEVDLEVNEDLAASVLDLAREIYQNCEFEKNAFNCLELYFVEEREADKERARMIFTKKYFQDDEFVRLIWIFTNGRLDKYKEKFVNMLESDTFYQQFSY